MQLAMSIGHPANRPKAASYPSQIVERVKVMCQSSELARLRIQVEKGAQQLTDVAGTWRA